MASGALSPIDHIALTVSDIERAVHWYQTSFDCHLVQHERTFAILQFANIRLHLILPSEAPPHLAFVRADAHTYGELMEQRDGTNSTYLADPTGNPVELIGTIHENSR